MSHECNDYIIKDGEFLRDFDGMYRAFADPWEQAAGVENDLFNRMAFFMLDHLIAQGNYRINQVLDAGCAFGYHAPVLLALSKARRYVGTDISPTAIKTARERLPQPLQGRCEFRVDDVRAPNDEFRDRFELIFSSKTLYYVAPEIDKALDHLDSYLLPGGLFCFVYNTTEGAFSGQWLTYQALREKLLARGMSCLAFAEFNRWAEEVCAVGVFAKPAGQAALR